MSNVLQKNADVVCRAIAGECLLIPVAGNLADLEHVFALNPVAEYIWSRIDGQRTLDEIANGIVARFDVQPEEAAADVREFAAQLREAGLVSDV